MINEWSIFLNIPKNMILQRYSDRHKKECISIQVNSVIFRKMFEIIINEVFNKNLLDNQELRRGLIRGGGWCIKNPATRLYAVF